MNTHSLRKLILPLVMVLVLLACALPVLPSPAAPDPTSNPGSIQTIVVATAGAAQTQTALVIPPPTDTLISTSTLAPSLTPTGTLTATATVIFVIPTATNPPTATSDIPTQSAGASCQLVAQTPANGTAYGARERFNAQWTIRNTGDETWIGDNIDFFHSGGRDMHESDVVDLPRNVRTGAEVTLVVEMRAPADSGTYTSTWTLGTLRDALCTVSVRIIVQ
jgi:hypothetical protein